jgi:hypothetical protein
MTTPFLLLDYFQRLRTPGMRLKSSIRCLLGIEKLLEDTSMKR